MLPSNETGTSYKRLWFYALTNFIDSDQYGYYDEMKVINCHTTLRRLWINEGKRRGYELVDA